MRARKSFDYAVVRVVPLVERGEFVNAGVVLLCREAEFLDARFHLDEGRLRALCPDAPVAAVQAHLDVMARICAGDPAGGPIAGLDRPARFHWLVAPRSTVVQTSPVHCGLCDDPAEALDALFVRLVD